MNRIELLGLLPAIFQRGLRPSDSPILARWDAGESAEPGDLDTVSPLAALLDVMIDMQAPAQEAIERFPETLFPEQTSHGFLAMLALWLHVDRRMAPDEAALRPLLAHAARLWRMRGTQRGLEEALECVLGPDRYEVSVPEPSPTAPRRTAVRFRTFHVRVRAPSGRTSWRPALERLIDAMKPIHLSHELLFDL